jgi:histidinol-phosphatase (PHP family)
MIHMSGAKLPADYHTHTPLCMHAEGAPETYIDRAIKRGVAEYGISDHAPQSPEPFDEWRMREDQLDEYFEWIDRARVYAGDRLAIRAGLECDWFSGNEKWIESLTSKFGWDYLIGSIHYLSSNGDLWGFDNPSELSRWAEADIEFIWKTYWDEYATMARTGLFDFLGHPDLIKKFGYKPEGDLRRFYDPVIEAVADSGVAIELNMAGLNKPCAEAYPSSEFLKLAASAKIPITLSSDAHAPSEVAQDFEQGVSILEKTGFTSTCLIEKRMRKSKPIK